ncbi:MAG: hypothetical protein Q7J16_03430 [Candidatus Cloacimonadales bacterium]|nr:hypothetical protein [Candidatus Cloacimonadales bacterium]
MFKDQIYKKGLHKAPEELEIDVLLYAAQNIEKQEEPDLSSYFSWLPLAGFLFLLQDIFSGHKVRIRPELQI